MGTRTLATALAGFLIMAATAADADGQATRRYGVWKLRSDAPPPSSNVMTYAPYGDGGMSVTVESTNSDGRSSKWGYVTMFDGVFRTVDGQDGAETAVVVVDDRTTRIYNKRDGRVYQVLLNVLSEDGNTIENEYVRLDEDGEIVRITHATYERIR